MVECEWFQDAKTRQICRKFAEPRVHITSHTTRNDDVIQNRIKGTQKCHASIIDRIAFNRNPLIQTTCALPYTQSSDLVVAKCVCATSNVFNLDPFDSYNSRTVWVIVAVLITSYYFPKLSTFQYD